jgi:acylphosphatase
MTRRVRANITGRVQGVSFRATTAIEARRLGLVGWVRNRTDGSVELEAEGDAAAIAELLAWCAHGPPAARVANVAIDELAPVNAEAEFAITATER